MVWERDDDGLRIIGYNEPIEFYDPNRTLQAVIYLADDDTLNIGASSTGAGSEGGQITDIVAGDGLDGGGDSGTVVLLAVAGPGINVTGTGIGLAGNRVLLYDSGGAVVREYAATSAGLDNASSAAAAGDVVWLPAATISGDHTLTAGVHYIGVSRYASKLTGQITLGDGTTLECCSVERTANDATTLKGVVAPSSGTAKVRDCDLTCVQSGSGNAYAVSIESSGDIEVWSCYSYGSSGSGAGYGGFHDVGAAGNGYWYGGRARGSTAPFNE